MKHTLAEWLAEPLNRYLELIDGEYFEKAAPGFDHGVAQGRVLAALVGAFSRPAGSGGSPGGWWIAAEVDVRIGDDGFRPDIVGWRRERVAAMPGARPVEIVPDWICEVVSESNRAHDAVRKLRKYRAGVAHYWLLDPTTATLSVFRLEAEGYLNVLIADRDELVRAPPFELVELRVGELLGDDPLTG